MQHFRAKHTPVRSLPYGSLIFPISILPRICQLEELFIAIDPDIFYGLLILSVLMSFVVVECLYNGTIVVRRAIRTGAQLFIHAASLDSAFCF